MKQKVTIIGAGGVGSRIIPLAVNMYDLTVMDGDVFEKKNLDRQLVARKHIGTNKADAMAKMHGCKSIPHMLEAPDALDGHSCVVCVPDNHMCRIIALEAADLYGFNLILAGNEEFTANAMFYNVAYQGTSIDPRVKYPDMLEGSMREAGEACATRITTKPQTATANAMAATFSMSLLMWWLGELPSNELIKSHAPFELIWDRVSVHTVRGFSE